MDNDRFLILEKGAINKERREARIKYVIFDWNQRYQYDLSNFNK